jgi:hypothetical protein
VKSLYLLALAASQVLYRACEGYLWGVGSVDDDGEPEPDDVNAPVV